ncbi:MAG: M28 family peptidase, partial [Thermoplasmata archaeon]|nr:M28 family peptidase [Thermoplasmata archaeon]
MKSNIWRLLNDRPCHWNKQCKGIILYDTTNDCHFMLSVPGFSYALPYLTVNLSVGVFLSEYHDDTTISGYINQVYLDETAQQPHGAIGYNVMGNLTIDKSPDDATVVISNRYDGMWGQTPGDSGVGAAIVLGIAKYFVDNSIKPKYNLTFLFTTGEEYGFKGAKHFNDSHDYNIKYWFILDQLAFDQSDAALCLHYNNNDNQKIIDAIVNDSHYYSRTGYENLTLLGDGLGSEQEVASSRENCDTFCLVKDQDFRWDMWHRTGSNYSKGDCLDHTDRKDINVTAELFWNITKYFCVNPDCWFDNIQYETFDSTGGTKKDSLRATFKVKSTLPSDLVMVNATFIPVGLIPPTLDTIFLNFTANRTGAQHEVNFTLPQNVQKGPYDIVFKLYNSTGKINESLGFEGTNYNQTITSPTFYLHRWDSFGDERVGTSYENIDDKISGSVFTKEGRGVAKNITAYVLGGQSGNRPTYKCLLYRDDNSQLIGVTEEKQPAIGNSWITFSFPNPKPVLYNNVDYNIVAWGNNTTRLWYYHLNNLGCGRTANLVYGSNPADAVFSWNANHYSLFCSYTPDSYPPQIINVSCHPDTVGFGYNVTINANVTDNQSGVNTVKVNITYPDHTHGNYTMSHFSGAWYQIVFSNTWFVGQYNYTIWAVDNASNMNSSTGYHFHVSADATISIATLKNSYSGSQYINITDPPNPPENYTLVGRGLTWNTYYNASSGENILEAYQGPVNYQEDNDTWTPINNSLNQLTSEHPAYNYGYRTGNDRGLFGVYFKPNVQSDWPVAFTYNRSDDPTTHVIRSKLVGVGYVDPQSDWAYQYLQNVQSSQGQTNGNSVTYEDVFTGTDVTWSYGNTELKEEITLSNATKTVLQNHPPSMYGLNNGSSYLVFITKLDHQSLNIYNASGMLTGNVTISDTGIDFKDTLGQFKCALPLGEAYELNNESVRQKLTYRIIHLNGNTYLLSGL